MTEQTDTTTEPTAAESPATASTGTKPETPENGNREAAKYRRQLRDTEQQLETTQTALTAARTGILRSALDGYKVGPNTFNTSALADAGLNVDELFGDDGQIDQERLDSTMATLAENKPYMFTPRQRFVIPREGETPTKEQRDGWTEAFTPKQKKNK